MTSVNVPGTAPWRDRGRTIGERAEALLAEMTREEKIAQLGSVWMQPGNEAGGRAGAGPGPHDRRAGGGPAGGEGARREDRAARLGGDAAGDRAGRRPQRRPAAGRVHAARRRPRRTR